MARTNDRYAPARRLQDVRTMLAAGGGTTLQDIAERFDVTRKTASRYIAALQASGEPLYEEKDGARKLWRMMPGARHATFTISTSQLVSLFLSRRMFDCLTGTGLKEDLDELFERLEATLKKQSYVKVKNLDRKFFDVNEAAYLYEGSVERVDDLVTAILREERVELRHVRVRGGDGGFLFEPYSLFLYKKGLYVVGYSHHHASVRTFALDGLLDATWQKGAGFEYPADYDPSRLTSGAFGLIGGAPPTRVRVRFTAKVARYVERRRWHESQKIEPTSDGGVELTMTIAGTVELLSWLLGFGPQAEVMEPPSLREELAREARRMLEIYDRR